MNITAIILAAGQASRFGRPKQLLKLQHSRESILEHSVSTAIDAGCQHVSIVTGAYHQEISELPFPSSVTLVHNLDWAKGMGHSLACGAATVNSEITNAILIMLADQPAINTETIKRLVNQLHSPEITIALCENKKNQGPPALFDITYLPELCRLKYDNGAKSIVANHLNETAFVQAPESVWDIDTENSWRNFCQFSKNKNP